MTETEEHELMIITSVQGYCRCGQWGMATDGGLNRLRELHAEHRNRPACTHPHYNSAGICGTCGHHLGSTGADRG